VLPPSDALQKRLSELTAPRHNKRQGKESDKEVSTVLFVVAPAPVADIRRIIICIHWRIEARGVFFRLISFEIYMFFWCSALVACVPWSPHSSLTLCPLLLSSAKKKVVQFFEAAALAGDAAAAMQLGNLYLSGSRGVPQVRVCVESRIGQRNNHALFVGVYSPLNTLPFPPFRLYFRALWPSYLLCFSLYYIRTWPKPPACTPALQTHSSTLLTRKRRSRKLPLVLPLQNCFIVQRKT